MKLIIGSVFITFVSLLIGRLIPPFSALLGTTLLIPLSVGYINFSSESIFGLRIKKKLPIVLRIALLYICVIISFITDFIYPPGTKDAEGDAAVLVSSYAGLIVGGVTMIKYLLKERKIQKSEVNIGQIILIVVIPMTWLAANFFRGTNILYEIFG